MVFCYERTIMINNAGFNNKFININLFTIIKFYILAVGSFVFFTIFAYDNNYYTNKKAYA